MSRRLTVADHLTLNALLDPTSPTFLNQTRSWLAIRPHCTINSAAAHASRWVRLGKIVEAMARILNKTQAEGKLTKYVTALEKASQLTDARDTIMDLMRLQGEIVSKQETKDTTPAASVDAIKLLIRSTLRPSLGSADHSSTLPPPTNPQRHSPTEAPTLLPVVQTPTLTPTTNGDGATAEEEQGDPHPTAEEQ